MASKNGNPGAANAGAKRVSSEVRRPLYTPARAATLARAIIADARETMDAVVRAIDQQKEVDRAKAILVLRETWMSIGDALKRASALYKEAAAADNLNILGRIVKDRSIEVMAIEYRERSTRYLGELIDGGVL